MARVGENEAVVRKGYCRDSKSLGAIVNFETEEVTSPTKKKKYGQFLEAERASSKESNTSNLPQNGSESHHQPKLALT